MTDLEISSSGKLKTIDKIAKKLKIKRKDLFFYGNYMAKIENYKQNKEGKLVLVTAINPTSLGEGKTTISIGLADSLSFLKKSVSLSLREPSLGPVFGIKGGATGGGLSQVCPMEDINLHFTGDFHAITSANNLLSAYIDNHIYQGNKLRLDKNKILFSRCVDLNDRALRNIEVELKNEKRKDSYTITAASEIMAIICLSKDFNDLKRRLGNILIGMDLDNKPVFCKDLHAEESMAILLKDAIKPNLVQTLYNTPAVIHGGPFANIAHGCSSVIATKLCLNCSDYTITEAGFGAELGAQKFLDTKCRILNKHPDAVVIVATIRALKLHGGAKKEDYEKENLTSLKIGIDNLLKHIDNIKNVYHLPVVVAINKFSSDKESEIEFVKNCVKEKNVKAITCDSFSKGKTGCINLAEEVIKLCELKNDFTYCYDLSDSIEEKINLICKKIYGAKDVEFTKKAREDLKLIKTLDKNFPVIIAKTQYSLSDDKNLLGAPKDFTITISSLGLKNGAEFVVAIAGDILLMPGLPKTPQGLKMRINDGLIEGLI